MPLWQPPSLRRKRSPLLAARRQPAGQALSRRGLLQALGVGMAGLPLAPLLVPRPARAFSEGQARRVIFFFFPDGVPDALQEGEQSLWHCTGSEHDFSLSTCLEGLGTWADRCVFFNDITLPGDPASGHMGGYQKLMTASSHGLNQSIDQALGAELGVADPWSSIYLGCQAAGPGSTDYNHLVHPVAGTTTAPEDDPRVACELLFGSALQSAEERDTKTRALALVEEDLLAMRSRLGAVETDKLDHHRASLASLEARLSQDLGDTDLSDLDTSAITDDHLYAAATFPALLQAQLELTVLAMEVGLTRVATIQCSSHHHQLAMNEFEGTSFYDPDHVLDCHTASHYGSAHDLGNPLFTAHIAHRQWWVAQLASLLEMLDARPEGDGTMLDHSIVVFMSDVADGNAHSHTNMPFILAGGAGGAWSTGRLLGGSTRSNAQIWTSVAQAMGSSIQTFGDFEDGEHPEL